MDTDHRHLVDFRKPLLDQVPNGLKPAGASPGPRKTETLARSSSISRHRQLGDVIKQMVKRQAS